MLLMKRSKKSLKSETFFIIGLSSLLLMGRNFQTSGIKQLILTESPAACGLWCRGRASWKTRVDFAPQTRVNPSIIKIRLHAK